MGQVPATDASRDMQHEALRRVCQVMVSLQKPPGEEPLEPKFEQVGSSTPWPVDEMDETAWPAQLVDQRFWHPLLPAEAVACCSTSGFSGPLLAAAPAPVLAAINTARKPPASSRKHTESRHCRSTGCKKLQQVRVSSSPPTRELPRHRTAAAECAGGVGAPWAAGGNSG
jgi:hypothetical protein